MADAIRGPSRGRWSGHRNPYRGRRCGLSKMGGTVRTAKVRPGGNAMGYFADVFCSLQPHSHRLLKKSASWHWPVWWRGPAPREGAKPRHHTSTTFCRTSSGWTAEGGCPYVGILGLQIFLAGVILQVCGQLLLATLVRNRCSGLDL